ncbi:PLP-dependent transferase [Fomitopsis serialis]|uniref:PLP-dependent transferase n=1 Tax=Fomitopsis serialis TaxID=139415 RepID=UPI002007462A|nr:PLP-dependent transferase [Neoantrodia serialis]KAH9930085.1 PLP-dependent transferase [Neoantrodia serialis]
MTAIDTYTYDAGRKPPPFGHALRPFWAFDPGFVNMNHGSYGSLPLPVLLKCQELTLLAERNPTSSTASPIWACSKKSDFARRKRVADVVNAELDEIVLVPNATHGINTVLRNFEWKEGDVIIEATTTYNAVSRTIRSLSDRSAPPRPTPVKTVLTFPMTRAQILDDFRVKIKEVKGADPNVDYSDTPPDATGAQNRKGNKIVAVIDSIISNPGMALPWKELAQICKEEGVWSVIDGAHSIGQELDINLSAAKPDFFISNCHKWFYAKRGCALLYVPKRNQYIIKSSIPTSHAYLSPNDSKPPPADETNFVLQHECRREKGLQVGTSGTGTADQIPYLSIGGAIDFRQWLGGEAVINAYCHQLALDGGKRLAEYLGTKVLDETGEFTLNMTNVQLPLPTESANSEFYTPQARENILRDVTKKLLLDWNVSAGFFVHAGAWWTRCSAQVWNDISDFEYVGKAFKAICGEITEIVEKGGEFPQGIDTR